MSMTIMEGLKELKMIDKRYQKIIEKLVDNAALKSNVAPTYEDKQADKVSGWIQSAKDLVERKIKLRCAILKTNLETKVVFRGKEYSLQEILYMKDGGKKMGNLSGFQLMDQLITALKRDKTIEAELSRMPAPTEKEKAVTLKRYFDVEMRDKMENFQMDLIQNLDALIEHANVTTMINVDPLPEEADK